MGMLRGGGHEGLWYCPPTPSSGRESDGESKIEIDLHNGVSETTSDRSGGGSVALGVGHTAC